MLGQPRVEPNTKVEVRVRLSAAHARARARFGPVLHGVGLEHILIVQARDEPVRVD